MTEAAPDIFVAIEASGIAAAIRQSRFIYMLANIGHIVALTLFAGAIAVIDVRLLGGLSATSPGRLIPAARKAALGAFLLLALSGAVLFAAEASHVVLNRAFQLKMVLVTLALLNVLWVESVVVPAIRAMPPFAPLPRSARAGAMISLALWLGVAICGRAIAYF